MSENYNTVTREMLKQENELIQQRIGWSTAAQGFLFTGLYKTHDKSFDDCVVITDVIIALGIFVAVVSIWGVIRSFIARHELLKAYKAKRCEELYPRVIGRDPGKGFKVLWSPNILLPSGILVIWVLVLIFQRGFRVDIPLLIAVFAVILLLYMLTEFYREAIK